MSGPYEKRAHLWIAPYPGQGRDRMCKHCGVRMSVAGKDSECGAVDTDEPQKTVDDYDPFSA